MNEQVLEVISDYLDRELGRAISLPDAQKTKVQQEAFLGRFGPGALSEMSDNELLAALPVNVLNDQPMDYWLEYKNDETFSYRNFGSITGGSMAKFGTWQDKKTGEWRNAPVVGRQIQNISQSQALEIVKGRRKEMLAAVEALRAFDHLSAENIDPDTFQQAIQNAAPDWHSSAWLHKYLHLICPELVTWNATRRWAESTLYSVGQVPKYPGQFSLDLQTIRFWNRVPALQDLPVGLRYRVAKDLLGPRDHWCLEVDGGTQDVNRMLDQGCLSLGPSGVADLSPGIALTKKTEVKLLVAAASQHAEVDASLTQARNLVEFVHGLKEGSIIALTSGASTVIAVGEVAGSYRFDPEATLPHQVPVSWHHRQSFETQIPREVQSGRLKKLRPIESTVADMEASLLVNGIGRWPKFGRRSDAVLANSQKGSKSSSSRPAELPPLEGIARQVVDMLERKRQVILYGPPGTGKTYQAERVALEIVARHEFRCLASQLSETQRKTIYGQAGQDPMIATCTFHPMYSYEDFIEGYRAKGSEFVLRPGIFKRMADAARKDPSKKYILIIDEINRGNIPKIFGELITLLEASKRGKTRCVLPLSNEPFTVPDNLFVLGTMNTADRSILLLDTALRRRFAFKEMLPDPSLLRGGTLADLPLSTWLRSLNRRIVEQLGRDGRNLQIGHAYLMPGGKPAATLRRIANIVRDEIWPLLQEYCYDDTIKLAKILAADQGGIYDSKRAELRFELFGGEADDELAQALIAVVTPEDRSRDAELEQDVLDDDDDASEPLSETDAIQ